MANEPAQYNGNISAMIWASAWDGQTRGYGYSYDQINQLTAADYGRKSGSTFNADLAWYSVSGLQYDLNGNIELVMRNTEQNSSAAVLDNLDYDYEGNRLTKVTDTGLNLGYDFGDGANLAAEYLYDANGNLVEDKNKGITAIEYNHLNLPIKITFSSNDSIKFAYTSTGAKLRKEVFESGALTLVKDYAGSFVYNGNTLEFLHTSEGRAIPETDGSFTYEYYLKDHLGNTRVSFNETAATVKQEDHYYPFGMRLGGGPWVQAGTGNKFLYNGKELEDDLGLNVYDYGWRRYDFQLGRWLSVDPVDEFHSPYLYVRNDPISRLDPDGMDDIYYDQQGNELSNLRVDTGFWSFDWLFGDSYYMIGDNGPLSHGGFSFWEIESAVPEDLQGQWLGFENYDELNKYFAKTYAAEGQYPFNLDEVREKSPSGALWDVKLELSTRKFYIIQGKGYLRDYAGNYTWATIMSNSAWPLRIAKMGAGYFQTFGSKNSTVMFWIKNAHNLGDDPRDSDAINNAYFSNPNIIWK